MNEPGEPSDRQKAIDDAAYLVWCAVSLKDPEDQQVAREYDEWWEEEHPPGEEERW